MTAGNAVTENGDLLKEAGRVATLISSARSHLADGKMVDLGALEGKVRMLCENIDSAPPSDATLLKAALNGMLEDLEFLAQDLARQHMEIDALANGKTMHKAIGAYQVSSQKKEN